MRRSIGLAIVALAAVAGLAGPADAATGRPVQTETITIPEEALAPDAAIETTPHDASGAETEEPPPDEGPPPDAAPETTLPKTTAPAEDDLADALPEVFYDPALLPEPVQQLREVLIVAAATGDVEQLRPIIEIGPSPPVLSFAPIGDPIEHLVTVSGDEQGREILAILIEVLEAGYVHVDVGTPEEMYVWPYFARYPLEALTARQMVEVYKLLTAGDFEEMKFFGAYIFYRLGIGPDGTWHFFVAGD